MTKELLSERTDDAILAVALNEWIARHVKRGEQVTQLEAFRILAAAQAVNIRPPRSLALLGFELRGELVEPLPDEVHYQVLMRVIQTGSARRVLQLLAHAERESDKSGTHTRPLPVVQRIMRRSVIGRQ